MLAHIVRKMYPDVPLVFCNTGLEYPEIQEFAKEQGAEIVRPKMMFPEVITTYGYPIAGKEIADAIHYARLMDGCKTASRKRQELMGVKTYGDDNILSPYNKQKWLPLCRDTDFLISDKCCMVIKKSPLQIYMRQHKSVPILATRASESMIRTQSWIRHGCNVYEGKAPKSCPMSFWLEKDVLKYIHDKRIDIASVYGKVIKEHGQYYCTGYQRTGCIFCGFGANYDQGKTRFQLLSESHPRQYEYLLSGGQYIDNPYYSSEAPEYDGDWKNWNPKKIWVPSKDGLGMKHVFDMCNELYGKDFIRYEV